MIFKGFRGVTQTDIWLSFPENGLANIPIFYKKKCPEKLKFQKNFWMSYPGFPNKGKHYYERTFEIKNI